MGSKDLGLVALVSMYVDNHCGRLAKTGAGEPCICACAGPDLESAGLLYTLLYIAGKTTTPSKHTADEATLNSGLQSSQNSRELLARAPSRGEISFFEHFARDF